MNGVVILLIGIEKNSVSVFEGFIAEKNKPQSKTNSYNKSSAVAEMVDHLATVDIGRKVGSCFAPLCGWRGAGSHLTQCRLG